MEFGTNKNTVTSVEEVIKIINFWGSGIKLIELINFMNKKFTIKYR